MSEKTIFKRIIDGEIPADIVYEDEHCLVFHDIAPKAPTHLLLIPRKEIRNISAAEDSDQLLLGHLMMVARDLSLNLGLENGFRLVTNNGPDGGQEVEHLHFHLMAGRKLEWPPG